MISVTVHNKRNKLLREFVYSSNDGSLEEILARVQAYVIDEQLNLTGECYLRAFYKAPEEKLSRRDKQAPKTE